MGNIGKARVSVGFSDSLVNVKLKPDYSTFDVSSDFLKEMVKKAGQHPPQDIDFDGQEGTFTVMYPSKQLYRINNYIEGDLQWSHSQTARKVTWLPIGYNTSSQNVVGCYVKVPPAPTSTTTTTATATTTTEFNDNYTLRLPSANYAEDTSYTGPRWWTRPDYVGRKTNSTADQNDSIASDPSSKNYSTSIEQYQVTPGMWWGIRTVIDLKPQVGIWLTVKLSGEKKQTKQSFLAVNINEMGTSSGSGSSPVVPSDSFSIVIDENSCYLIDYYNPYIAGQEGFSTDLSKWGKFSLHGMETISRASEVKIGVKPMIGYLVIYINGVPNVYARRELTENTYKRFVMSIKNVKVYGRNSTVEMDLSAMTFSESGTIETTVSSTIRDGAAKWSGSETGPSPSATTSSASPLCVFPGANGKTSVGVCCSTYQQDGTTTESPGDSSEEGIENICPNDGAWGTVKVSFTADPENPLQEKMKIEMNAKKISCFGGSELPVGAPYLFRLRGNKVADSTNGVAPSDWKTDVISMSEAWDSPDYVHITHTVDVTLYNPDGRYNYLLDQSKGVQVKARIGSEDEAIIFTGITLDSSTSEVAGKETITFHCKDYMEILEMNMFLNCPYYDGMWDINAATDIALRAGINPKNETSVTVDNQGQGYFLPAGYSFSEPRMKWSGDTTLKEGLLNVLKLGEKICFFDNEGNMIISDLQGGLAYDTEGAAKSSEAFVRDPDGDSDFNIILDEKRDEKLVGSVVNSILVTSWDRQSGSVIFYGDENSNSNAIVPFKKTLYYDQPAFGSVEAVKNWVDMVKDRVFKVPRRITFKTLQKNFSLKPLQIITVDGKYYRVKALNRRFDADSNSIVTDITGEWYGA